MAKLDLDTVRHALKKARELGMAEVEVYAGEDSFAAKLEPIKVTKKKTASLTDAAPTGPQLIDVKSPVVGYFRPADKPLAIGDEVAIGQPLGSVMALGLRNDIEAQAAGKVAEVLVELDQPVDFGQVLYRLEA